MGKRQNRLGFRLELKIFFLEILVVLFVEVVFFYPVTMCKLFEQSEEFKSLLDIEKALDSNLALDFQVNLPLFIGLDHILVCVCSQE